MAVKNKNIMWLVGIILLVFAIFFIQNREIFATNTNPTLTRSVPTTALPNSQFTITYNALGGSGKWGATIEETLSGNCRFKNAGTLGIEEKSIKIMFLSTDGQKKSVIVETGDEGSCEIRGDYKFGNGPITSFADDTVTITGGGGGGDGDGDGGEGYTCTELGGNICSETATCEGTWISASDTDRCCLGSCVIIDGDGESPITKFLKDIGKKIPITGDETIDGIIIIFIGLFLFSIILNKFGK